MSGVPSDVSLGTATAAGTIRNDDPAGSGSVSIARASAQKAEGHAGTTPFTFTVTRTGDLSGVAGVAWAVSGGSASGTTAAAGADFVGGQSPAGRVTFASGQASQTITVSVAADASSLTALEDVNRAAGEVIDLSAIDAIAGTAANDLFSFISTSAFGGVAGQLRWEDEGAVKRVQGDVNGDSVADLTLLVRSAVPIDAGWFQL